MTTAWTLPTIFSQYAEPGGESFHVEWEDNFSALRYRGRSCLQSKGALEHIARSPKHDLRNKTYYIRATGFNFQNLPETVSGIEVRLLTRRYGRATDDTIELCLNEQTIGDNQATISILPEKIYGGETNLWSTDNLSIDNIQDKTFGIVIRFQAHPHWPHKDPVLIDLVEMRIH